MVQNQRTHHIGGISKHEFQDVVAKFLQTHGPIPCPSPKMQNICFSAHPPLSICPLLLPSFFNSAAVLPIFLFGFFLLNHVSVHTGSHSAGRGHQMKGFKSSHHHYYHHHVFWPTGHGPSKEALCVQIERTLLALPRRHYCFHSPHHHCHHIFIIARSWHWWHGLHIDIL